MYYVLVTETHFSMTSYSYPLRPPSAVFENNSTKCPKLVIIGLQTLYNLYRHLPHMFSQSEQNWGSRGCFSTPSFVDLQRIYVNFGKCHFFIIQCGTPSKICLRLHCKQSGWNWGLRVCKGCFSIPIIWGFQSNYTYEMNRICFIMNHFLLSVTFVQNLLDNFIIQGYYWIARLTIICLFLIGLIAYTAVGAWVRKSLVTFIRSAKYNFLSYIQRRIMICHCRIFGIKIQIVLYYLIEVSFHFINLQSYL